MGQWGSLQAIVAAARAKARNMTAWRIEGTLREFPKFPAVNVWFNYPVHTIDQVGILNDIQPETEKPPWKKGAEKNKKSAADRKAERQKAVEEAIENGNFGEAPTLKEVAEFLGISERTARDRVNEHGGYSVRDGKIYKDSECGED